LSHHADKIIFSSSAAVYAAVYGDNGGSLIDEESPKAPVNAYGESKLMFESILSRYGKAYGIKHISLRYFNAAGATLRLGEDHKPETHLLPCVLEAAMTGKALSVYGADYATADGTCVRDYVHVEDIAHAHILALEKLDGYSGRAFNLGNQRGYSVMEVLNRAREITGINIPINISGRRPGDPATLIASSARARQELGWKADKSDLDTIIRSAWDWKREHPHGYGS